jgi:RNA polymerase sigma factor (sigma-70 family)
MQHLEIVRMRAAENRRWILRSTNDGITGTTDPAGRLRGTLPPALWRLVPRPVRGGGGGSADCHARHAAVWPTISGRVIRLQQWMEQTLRIPQQIAEQNRQISEVVQRERARLRNFVRKRVPDAGDAEDILQDVLHELVETYRLIHPVEHASAWLYRVARNRIVDFFRKKRLVALGEAVVERADDEGVLTLEDLLPSPDAGPEAAYARSVLLQELNAALEELPLEQRDVFIAHQIEGRSFRELVDDTGVGLNTLLSRKRYAVMHLRRRLQAIYDEYLKPGGRL